MCFVFADSFSVRTGAILTWNFFNINKYNNLQLLGSEGSGW